MNLKKITVAAAALLVSILLASGAYEANAQEADAQEAKVDLASFQCKDIMRMSGEDRSIALGVLNGFALGKKGATSYVSSKVGEKTDAFIEYCLDHPDEKALAAFARFP